MKCISWIIDQASANDEFEKSPHEESPNSYETCSAKYFRDINSSNDLKTLLDPYFENKKIDKKYLEILDQEKMDGKIMIDCDMDDLHKLFPDMPFGDKKRVLGIVKSILEEETKTGPFLKILSKIYYKQKALIKEKIDSIETRVKMMKTTLRPSLKKYSGLLIPQQKQKMLTEDMQFSEQVTSLYLI